MDVMTPAEWINDGYRMGWRKHDAGKAQARRIHVAEKAKKCCFYAFVKSHKDKIFFLK
jgi:hypothetical protein